MGGKDRKRKRNNGNSVRESVIVKEDSDDKENRVVGSRRVGIDGGKYDGVGTNENLVTVFKRRKRGKEEGDEKTVVAWGGKRKESLKREQLDNPSRSSSRLRPRKEVYAYRKLQLRVESDFLRIVGRRVRVYWPLDRKWYPGHVASFERDKKIHHIVYDDGEEESLILENEKFEVEVLMGEVSGNRFIYNPETVDDNSDETSIKTEIRANDDQSKEGRGRQQFAIDALGIGQETGNTKVVADAEEQNERELVASTSGNMKQKNEIELHKFVSNVEKGNEKERGTGKDETKVKEEDDRGHGNLREDSYVEERSDKDDVSTKFGGSVGRDCRSMKRKNRKRKGDISAHSFQKVQLNESDYERILGRRIRVYWPLDRKWYIARVVSFDARSKRHHILYEDGDTENLHLCNERLELEIAAGETFEKQTLKTNEKEADFHSYSEKKNKETIKVLPLLSTSSDSSMSKAKVELEEGDGRQNKDTENELGSIILSDEGLIKLRPGEGDRIPEAQTANILKKENEENVVTNTRPMTEARGSMDKKAVATYRFVFYPGVNTSNKQVNFAEISGQHGPEEGNELLEKNVLHTSETEAGSSLLMSTEFHQNGTDNTETSKRKHIQEGSSMKNLKALETSYFDVFGQAEHLDFESATKTSARVEDLLAVSESDHCVFGEEHGSGEQVNKLAINLNQVQEVTLDQGEQPGSAKEKDGEKLL